MAHTAEHMMGSAAQGVKKASEKVQKAGGNMATHNAAQDSVLEGQRAADFHARSGMYANAGLDQNNISQLRAKQASDGSLTDSEKDDLNLADNIDKEAKSIGKDYAKQARKDFAKDWMYKNLTGMDSPNANSSNALRVGQQFWDGEQWRTANWLDVQEAGKKGGQQAGNLGAERANKKNKFKRQMAGDIPLPENNGY